MPPRFDDIAATLDRLLCTSHFPEEVPTRWHPGTRPVRRLGLALDPPRGLAAWAEAERLDALFLHRPWHLDRGTLPPGVGVLAAHRAFDERLTIGYNPDLAARLELTDAEPFGDKDGRPLGLLGTCLPTPFEEVLRRVEMLFGDVEDVLPTGLPTVGRVAAVGAMTAPLVEAAHARGAGLYLTGQLRVPGRGMAEATGIGVVAVGHARSERWGLTLLGEHLAAAFPALEVSLADG